LFVNAALSDADGPDVLACDAVDETTGLLSFVTAARSGEE